MLGGLSYTYPMPLLIQLRPLGHRVRVTLGTKREHRPELLEWLLCTSKQSDFERYRSHITGNCSYKELAYLQGAPGSASSTVMLQVSSHGSILLMTCLNCHRMAARHSVRQSPPRFVRKRPTTSEYEDWADPFTMSPPR
jgi:hypothetical protein